MAEKNTTNTNAKDGKTGNRFIDEVFGALIFQQPTGNKTTPYKNEPITQHRIAQVRVELGKGTGVYMSGFSVVALVRTDKPNAKAEVKGRGPSFSKGGGAFHQSFIEPEDANAERQFDAFLDHMAKQGIEWRKKTQGPSEVNPAMAVDLSELGIGEVPNV